MVSILISAYNQDPTFLVKDLHSQMEDLNKPFEIIIGNDDSDSKFMPIYSSLESLDGVKCYHPGLNLGRSRIRNALAEQAIFPYLLFIDGDALVDTPDFMSVYFENAESDTVICGGTAYYPDPPIKKEKFLRWKYGVKREARPAILRNENPYSGFSSFNFLIPASIFSKIRFNEAIKRYGHEDTFFGIELEEQGVKISHIDNQLIHNGLDAAEVFVEKTREGLLNLIELLNSHDDSTCLSSHIRILDRYSKIKKWYGHHLISLLNHLAFGLIERNLKGSRPSLLLFDLYKLCILNKNQA